jgi:hypothetical protein
LTEFFTGSIHWIAALHNKTRSTPFRRHVILPGQLPCQAEIWREETEYMATSTELAELEQRHRMLEDEIAEALRHPSTDDFKLAELKRRKLQVKDQIARLRTDTGATVH